MRYRKLRIAWSVGCGLVAVLLCALWLKSYWWWYSVRCRPTAQTFLTAWTEDGSTSVSFSKELRPLPSFMDRWSFRSYPPRSLESGSPMLTNSARLFFHRGPLGATIGMPIWMLAIMAWMLGVVPWIGWSSHFSLRTLLIATTLVAVVLGLIVWAVRG